MSARLRLMATSLLAAMLLLAAHMIGQAGPRVTGVDPAAAKPGDRVTISGENLEKKNVVAVYLSDSSEDHKVQVVEQTAEKITILVPKLRARDYNVSIQVRNDILIQPIRLTVQE